jgi:CyaY protein
MTDTEFIEQAERLLLRVEQTCDRINDVTDADLDAQRAGGMVTLTFSNRSQIVINWQKPLHEIWMAAKAGGFHYRFDGEKWMDTKGAGEFFAHLSLYASQQSALELNFASPC